MPRATMVEAGSPTRRKVWSIRGRELWTRSDESVSKLGRRSDRSRQTMRWSGGFYDIRHVFPNQTPGMLARPTP